jgi:hypothetical protein
MRERVERERRREGGRNRKRGRRDRKTEGEFEITHSHVGRLLPLYLSPSTARGIIFGAKTFIITTLGITASSADR